MLLNHIDRLTEDLVACEKKLEIKGDPPECKDGFPWKTVVLSVAAGYIINEFVD